MADIQSPQSSVNTLVSSSQATASTAPGLNAVPVSITGLSQALQNLTRSIQTNAIPLASPSGNSLTLATALGNISVTLPQLATSEQQILLQQLLSLVQLQRPLTLALPAGSPPSQAVLLIPTTVSPTLQTSSPSFVNVPVLPILTLTEGEVLPALVLPPSSVTTVLQINSQGAGLPKSSSGSSETLLQGSGLLSPPTTAQNSIGKPPTFSGLQNSQSTQPNLSLGEALELELAPTNLNLSDQSLSPSSVPLPSSSSASLPFPAPPGLGQSSSPNTSSLASGVGVAPPSITDFLSPGTDLILRINAVYLPSPSVGTNVTLPQMPALSLGPNQIEATVTGVGTDGQIILKSGDATFFVKAQVTAPLGTTLILTVEPARSPPLLTLPPLNSLNLPSLPQMMSALAQIDPQLVQQVMMTRIPQPSESLPGTLLLLFSAFKENGLRGWLGDDAIDRLTQVNKQNLIASLTREMNDASSPTQDPVVGQWHSYPLPLFAQNQFQSLMLYVHNEQDHTDKQSSGNAIQGNKVRFLIDMKLSKLGAMQIDGFVQTKKLDMILRSENFLPEGLHQSLRLSYIKALEGVGYTGTLNFQVGRQHWMVMKKPPTAGILT